MRWEGRRESSNVLDQRGVRTAGVVGGSGLILALLYFFLTGDPGAILEQVPQTGASGVRSEESDRQAEFVKVVLADTEDVWNQVFAEMGQRYQEPKLVLFSGSVRSACGMASAAVGPFYCPSDHQLYIDLSFFNALENQLGAKGDFAQAYVIAHEVGHHVQNLLGLMERGKSVALELQADCLAGVWAVHTERTKNVLEQGDLEEALGAAAAVGDDQMQRRSQGYVVPDSFTHGSSEQRMAAFMQGYRGRDVVACNRS